MCGRVVAFYRTIYATLSNDIYDIYGIYNMYVCMYATLSEGKIVSNSDVMRGINIVQHARTERLIGKKQECRPRLDFLGGKRVHFTFANFVITAE